MRMLQAGIVALALGVLPTSESVSVEMYLSGNDLHEECRPTARGSLCTGYILGVADAMQGYTALGEWRMCSSKNVNSVQVVDVVKAFLTAHPEIRHFAAASLVAKALAEAFPCPPR